MTHPLSMKLSFQSPLISPFSLLNLELLSIWVRKKCAPPFGGAPWRPAGCRLWGPLSAARAALGLTVLLL